MVLETSIATVPHRNFVEWGRIFGVAATVALAVGALGWTTSSGARSEEAARASASASASASATLAPPAALEAVEADSPPMTAEAWLQVDSSWDVLEVAAPGDGGPNTRGVYAVYLTPPGGERRLAFARAGLPDSTPRALAWDPGALVMLLANAANEFRVTDMQTGAYATLASPVEGDSIGQVIPLGRASDGRNYIAIYQGEEYDHVQVVAWDATGWRGAVDLGNGGVSPLQGDIAVLNQGGVLRTYNVVTGQQGPVIGGLDGCWFYGWATATEFSAECVTAPGNAELLGASIEGTAMPQDLGPSGRSMDLGRDTPGQLAGTPLVFQRNGEGVEVLVLTDEGLHLVAAVPFGSAPDVVTLAADSRWLLIGASAFPSVVDTRRGTLEDLGEGFGSVPGTIAFLAGNRD